MNPGTYLVSIIVPVYKVENYLRACIDSIVNQTYHNIEVLLVDDGSPDRCGAICDEYADRYAFVRALHKENEGQSEARNYAALIASGDFIVFVDSDDIIVKEHVEHLVQIQKKYDADLVIGGGFYWYDRTELIAPSANWEDYPIGVEETLKRLNYNQGMGAMPWSKLYRRELVLAHPYPKGRIYEDLATTYKIVCDCQRIAYTNRQIYYWRQRSGSTMHMGFDERQMQALLATKEQIEFMQAYFPAVLPSAKAKHEAKIVELLFSALEGRDAYSNYLKLKRESKYKKEVMRDPNVKRTQKIRIMAMHMGFIPSKIIFSFHEVLKRYVISQRQ